MTDERTIRSEDARSRRYREQLARKRNALATVGQLVGHARGSEWTRHSLPSGRGLPEGALIGRVALDRGDPELDGKDFYIGVYPIQCDGMNVFSWAAPVAETFFGDADPQSECHEWSRHAVARRTLTYSGDRIVDVEDESLRGARNVPDGVFPLNGTLRIEPPTSRATRPATSRFRGTRNTQRLTGCIEASSATAPPSPAGSKPERRDKPARRMRAEDTLLRALEAPRASSLASVLHTMQPDQYRAVTATPGTTWVFHGGPGTGKTVIAAHRACYLSNPARKERQVRRVLVLGPTEGYVHHVGPIIRQLDAEEAVDVQSIPGLLSSLAGLPRPPTGSATGPFDEVDPRRFEECLTVGYDLRQEGLPLSTRAVYNGLRSRIDIETSPGRSEKLPSWERARTWARYLPIVASCGIAAQRHVPEWGHIIVDEAQDVRPLEWTLIAQLCGEGANFTVLGDLNQRRHPTTFRAWEDVIRALREYHKELTASGREISTGYRSTRQILDYATRLIPKGNRPAHEALRDGLPVVVDHQNGDASLWQMAVHHAIELAKTYRTGSIALISPDVDGAVARVRRAGAKSHDRTRFEWRFDDGAPVAILRPDTARGLEFDAVVIVEPTDFPRDEFGSGSLFTSLTRANKELRVVHAKPLPDELRGKR